MFKKASMKIMARDSTTSASKGNQDLRPMHTLITAEKAVLLSLQKLGVEYTKAAEALRTWGSSEKDDLGSILTASTSLLNHFSLALSQYVAHGHTMQSQLEAMSKRGDALDNLKQRRDSAHRKAEETAAQLSKMDPQNKYYSMHTDALRRLRKDVRKLDSDIDLEDAAFGDFKRTATKVWLTLKFGGLHDCCEKGAIAGKYGKLVATEILEPTQPDMPRIPYSPHKVDNLLVEADQHITAIGHLPNSSIRARDSIRSSQESSNASPVSSSVSPHEPPSKPSPPQPPPKSASHQNNVPHQPQHFLGAINSSGGYHLQDPSLGGSRSPVNPSSIAGPSHFQSPPSERPAVQTHPPGSSDSGRYHVPPLSGGHYQIGNSSFSEGTSHPQDPNKTRAPPPSSSDHGGYTLQDPHSVSGHHRKSDASFSEGTSYWQNPPSARLAAPPVPMRPPGASESARYPSQDPPSLGGRHLNREFSTGTPTSHWQDSPSGQFPTPPRPSPIPESERYPLKDPPSLGERHLTSNSSFSAGPSHRQNPSSDRGHHRSDPSFSEQTSQWQNSPSDQFPMAPPRPPGSGGYPSQGPTSSGGPHRVGDPSGSSYSQHSPSDRFPTVSSESGRYSVQDQSHIGGGRPNGNSSFSPGKSHLHGPVIMAPPHPSESGGYAAQDPRSLGDRHLNGDSRSSGPIAGSSQWATNRFNAGSEVSTLPEGMREGSYGQAMYSWGAPSGGPSGDPNDSPPAYRDMVENFDNLPDTVGHFSTPPASGPNSNAGRW